MMTSVAGTMSEIPERFRLEQNYPNPFNPTTTIRYELAEASTVHVRVFDVLGREIQTLVNNRESAGTHAVVLDGSALPSGTYFYTMEAGTFRASKKFVLVK